MTSINQATILAQTPVNPFKPWRLSGTGIWVRCSDLAQPIDLTSVQGKVNSINQSNAVKRPVFHPSGGPNNQAYFEHDGVDDLVNISSAVNMTEFTIVLVMRMVSMTGPYSGFLLGSSRTGFVAQGNGGGIFKPGHLVNGTRVTQTTSEQPVNTWGIYVVTRTGTTYHIWLNGVDLALTPAADSGWVDNSNTIGGGDVQFNQWDWTEAGSLIRVITDQERNQVTRQLSIMYGIPATF